MNSTYEVNTKIPLIDYLTMVEEIAYGFISKETGKYQPHIGRINAMRLFYNYCVTKSPFDEKYAHDVSDVDAMEEIVEDDAFLESFNEAITSQEVAYLPSRRNIRYNFANAYRDALEIVDTEKSSIANAVVAFFNKVKTNVEPFLTDENIASISQIAKDVANGKTSAESIVDTYMNKLAESSDEDQKEGDAPMLQLIDE